MIFLLEIFQGCFTVQLSMSCCPFRDSSFSVSLCELLVKDFFHFLLGRLSLLGRFSLSLSQATSGILSPEPG